MDIKLTFCHGMVLVEMMVAMTVLAIVLLTLMQLINGPAMPKIPLPASFQRCNISGSLA
jgi:prepilin-type N-terminal cleavage/methylation domain-containing protein